MIKCCDCLVGLKSLSDSSVDLVINDLPYQSTNNFWDKKIPLEPLWTELLRVAKTRAAFIFFAQMPFAAELVMSRPKLFRYQYCWEKPLATGFLNVNKAPLRSHELILVFYRRLPVYHPQFSAGKPYVKIRKNHWKGEGCYNRNTERRDVQNDGQHYYPRDVIRFDSIITSGEQRFHSTQKPVALLEFLIKTYSNEGDIVLDCAIGSGSTGLACINTDRRFIGFELHQTIFEVAEKRLADARNLLL